MTDDEQRLRNFVLFKIYATDREIQDIRLRDVIVTVVIVVAMCAVALAMTP